MGKKKKQKKKELLEQQLLKYQKIECITNILLAVITIISVIVTAILKKNVKHNVTIWISMSTPKIARIIQVQKLLNERQNIIILRNMKQNKGFEEESIL